MSQNIRSVPVGSIYIQSGYGVPTHIATKGCLYVDINTGTEYINKDGVSNWVTIIDTTYPLGTIAFTGGTVNGPTNFTNGLTANTMSASTYYGDGSHLTGIAGSIFTGGTVTGPATFNAGLTSTTISATTYLGLPLDIRVTGASYNSGTTTFINNTGGTFSVTGFSTPQLSAVTVDGYFGTRLYPLDTSLNGFGLVKSVNGAIGFNAQNTNTGNGAYAAFTVGGDTSPYNKGASFIYYGSGYYRSELQNTTGIYNNVPFSIVSLNNTNLKFKTGNAFGTETTKLSISSGGTLNVATTPITDNTGDLVGRNSSGDLVLIDKNSAVSGLYLPLSGGTVYGPTIFTSGVTANTLNVDGLTQTSGITSTGGITFKQVTISSSYTATTSDYIIDVTSGTFSVTLPSAVGIQGRLLVVKNNGGGAVTVQPILGQNIDDKPFVILGETNTIQLASNGSNWVAISYNISTVNSSTGVFSFTGLSIASTTTFRVAPVKGWIVNDTTNPLSPQLYYLEYSGGTHTATYLSSFTETYIYLTSGGTISQTNIPLTEQQRRQNIFLGKLGHANKTNIVNAFSQPDFVLSPLAQLRDMFQPIGYINGGVYPYTNAANLTFATTAGYLYGLGINFANDTLNPSQFYVTGQTTTSFQYRTQTGGTTSTVTNIDPLHYDVGGVVTPLSGTKATNQRIYLLVNGQIRVQYGQTEYSNHASAIAGIATESFTPFSNFRDNGILIGILSILSSCTDLTDTTRAQFFLVSKFGETVGAAGGVSTTNLQQAYNNSTNPEILTNSSLGALHMKNGGGDDTIATLFEGSNSSGTTTSYIGADGRIFGSSISATTISATTIRTPSVTLNNNGLTATTISATTYLNLPTDIRVTGGTYSTGGTATFTNNTGGTFSVTGFSKSISGTTNYVSKFISNNSIGNSVIQDDGTVVSIGGAINSSYALSVYGNMIVSNYLYSNVIVPQFAVIYDGAGNVGHKSRGGGVFDFFMQGGSSASTNITFSDGSMYIAGTETLRINTFDRRLGIRTTSATEALDVNGNIRNRGAYLDSSNSSGGTNQYLMSTLTGTSWTSLPTDIRVTGGTYSTGGTATFTNNTGGTFSVTGFNTSNTLQTVYNNSSPAQITNGASNPFTLTNDFAGTSKVFSVKNTLGVERLYIQSDGYLVNQNSIVASRFISSVFEGGDGVSFGEQIGVTTLKPYGTGSVSFNRWDSSNRINYLSDYSQYYTDRSLIDKGYLNSRISSGITVTGNTSLQGLTATTISATTYNGSNYYSTGTYGSTNINASNNQSMIVFSGSNTVGGTGYTDFIKVTNTAAGATNPNKTIRVNNTGAIEFINSTYLATTFSISDNGIITITSPANVTSNSATNNALNIGTKGQLFDDGNFHIHSSSGAVWINALDGSAIRLGTQTNSGNSTVIVDTTTVGHSFFTKVQSGFNVAFGTEITMDNLKVRINGTGGSGGLVQAGAVSGSFAAYTTLLGNVAGAAVQGDTNSGGITFTTSYQNISGIQKTLSSGGDTTTLHLIDTTNSRIYRITAIHCQGTTGGYTSIERMS